MNIWLGVAPQSHSLAQACNSVWVSDRSSSRSWFESMFEQLFLQFLASKNFLQEWMVFKRHQPSLLIRERSRWFGPLLISSLWVSVLFDFSWRRMMIKKTISFHFSIQESSGSSTAEREVNALTEVCSPQTPLECCLRRWGLVRGHALVVHVWAICFLLALALIYGRTSAKEYSKRLLVLNFPIENQLR